MAHDLRLFTVFRVRSLLAGLAVLICLLSFHGRALAARTINSVIVNGAELTGSNSVEVIAGSTITITLNVTTSGGSTDDNWESTGLRIATSTGTYTCSNSPNVTTDTTTSQSYTITAPATTGTYNLYVRVFHSDSCPSLGNYNYGTYSNAIVVTPPTVTSIVRASSNPANTGSAVSWTVTFNRPVSGVDATDFQLSPTFGVSGATITSVAAVSPSGGRSATWTVTANTGTGKNGGDLGLNLVDDDTIVDSGNIPLGGSGKNNGNFTGQTYMVNPLCSGAPPNTPPELVNSAWDCRCDNFDRSELNPSPGMFGANWINTTSDASKIVPYISSRGFLRLTNNTPDNAKAATVPGIFPAKGNYISVEFRLYAYSGNSADGIGVTLSDYTVTPVPGAFGGSLGYAQKTNINGFAGGWMGVGIDEYGNYQNATEGRSGAAPNLPTDGRIRQSVAVRGSGSGSGNKAYPWLAGTTSLSTNIDNPISTPSPGHRYQVIVDARYDPTKTGVAVYRDIGSGFANLINLANIYDTASDLKVTQAPVPANWRISFTGSTGTNTNIHEIAGVRICAQKVYPPSGGTASGFSVIDEFYSATGPTIVNFIDGHIFMKRAGVPFKLNVAALNNNQIVTSYAASENRDVTIKLVDNSDGACVLDNTKENFCNATCKAKDAVSSQTLTFVSADQGKKLSADFTINSAYKNLVAIVGDSSLTTCSTDSFSVRPSFLELSTSATNTSTSGTPAYTAGKDAFTMTATAKTDASTTTAGYTGTPKVNNALVQAISPATHTGTVSGAFSPANKSISTGSEFTYDEVGRFKLPTKAVYDDDWSSADSTIEARIGCIIGSFSNEKTVGTDEKTSGRYGCNFGTLADMEFGRFIPHHFTLVKDNIEDTNTTKRSLVTPACASGNFTYMDQPFSRIKYTIEAQNAGKSVTQNYTGELAKGTVSLVAENADSGTDLSARIANLPATAWNAGVFSVDTNATYFRRRNSPPDSTADPDGPFDTLQLGVKVSDPDGPVLEDRDMNAAANDCGTGCDSRRIGDSVSGLAQPIKMRFGRLKLSNAHGSERLNLPIPMRAEYYNGTTFVTNTDDNCTALSTANILLNNHKGGITTSNMPNTPSPNFTVGGPFTSGVGLLKLLKPTSTPNSKGSVDVCVDLGGDPSGDTAGCTKTSANIPWLKGNWRGNTYNYDPRARATFGVFKNANEFIYIREMY